MHPVRPNLSTPEPSSRGLGRQTWAAATRGTARTVGGSAPACRAPAAAGPCPAAAHAARPKIAPSTPLLAVGGGGGAAGSGASRRRGTVR
eukprot:350941-Chlamydomonas_euryale.AAC.3